MDPTRVKRTTQWPAEELIARGYAAIGYFCGELDANKRDGFDNGVHKILDPWPADKRPADAWATIAAWSWGASRVMDYLETELDIDAKRVGLLGHSRSGKAALWCAAQDERFAIVISNDSGSTGAAMARGKTGETIAKINTTFPYWFCGNYKKYDGKEDELPIDQHELIALIAPRPVYVGSASLDFTADPKSEFRSALLASPVWKLWGKPGLTGSNQPPVNTPAQDGFVGYHLREGKHDLGLSDWNWYMDFAGKHLKNP